MLWLFRQSNQPRLGNNDSSQFQLEDSVEKPHWQAIYMRVNQKVRAIFKLRSNRDREEPAHCAVLTMPVEEFSHLQYSALSSVE